MLKMRLFRHRDGTLGYGVGYLYRITVGLFAALLLLGAFLNRNEEWFSWFSFPVITAVVLIAAAMYLDAWDFDAASRTVTSRFGILPVHRRRLYSFDEIESFSLSHFSKGFQGDRQLGKRRRFSEYLVFSLITTSGERKDIEIVREARSAGTVEKNARMLAEYCQLPLEYDREPDPDLSLGRSRRTFGLF